MIHKNKCLHSRGKKGNNGERRGNKRKALRFLAEIEDDIKRRGHVKPGKNVFFRKMSKR